MLYRLYAFHVVYGKLSFIVKVLHILEILQLIRTMSLTRQEISIQNFQLLSGELTHVYRHDLLLRRISQKLPWVCFTNVKRLFVFSDHALLRKWILLTQPEQPESDVQVLSQGFYFGGGNLIICETEFYNGVGGMLPRA